VSGSNAGYRHRLSDVERAIGVVEYLRTHLAVQDLLGKWCDDVDKVYGKLRDKESVRREVIRRRPTKRRPRSALSRSGEKRGYGK